MNKKSNTGFWVKNGLIMLFVISCTAAFLVYGPNPTSDMNAEDDSEATGVSAGVTRFYSEFRQVSSDPIKDRYSEDTIILEGNNASTIETKIKSLPQTNTQTIYNWDGNYKQRAFAKSSTLMTEMTKYAKEEGFNLIWDLSQDFKIRSRFTSTSTFVGALEEVAGALDNHFHLPIRIYFCKKNRTMVITERESAYLKVNCQKSQGSFQSF